MSSHQVEVEVPPHPGSRGIMGSVTTLDGLAAAIEDMRSRGVPGYAGVSLQLPVLTAARALVAKWKDEPKVIEG